MRYFYYSPREHYYTDSGREDFRKFTTSNLLLHPSQTSCFSTLQIKVYISQYIYLQWAGAGSFCLEDLPKNLFEFGIHGIDIDSLLWRDAIKYVLTSSQEAISSQGVVSDSVSAQDLLGGTIVFSNDKFDDIDFNNLYFETLDEFPGKMTTLWRNHYTSFAPYPVDALKEAINIGRFCPRYEFNGTSSTGPSK